MLAGLPIWGSKTWTGVLVPQRMGSESSRRMNSTRQLNELTPPETELNRRLMNG